ncbi:MAG: L,D-transpeptidase catalytic domain [Candidatus Parcubacteria bacterium]|jgi:hypothetical protein
MISASEPQLAEAQTLTQLELAGLSEAEILQMKEMTFQRLQGNIIDTANLIPDPKQREDFVRMQETLMQIERKSPFGLYPTKAEAIQLLSLWAAPQLRTLHAALQENETGLFIDAGRSGQTFHIVRRVSGSLQFIASARSTTGEDGVSPLPVKGSNATKSGLTRIEEIVRDHVVLGEDVSWEKKHIAGQTPFQILTKTGKSRPPMHIAPDGFANVGTIAYRFNNIGQAIHSGPIRSTQASHGCVRVSGWVAVALSAFLKKGTPIMIDAPTAEQERLLIASRVREKQHVVQQQPVLKRGITPSTEPLRKTPEVRQPARIQTPERRPFNAKDFFKDLERGGSG